MPKFKMYNIHLSRTALSGLMKNAKADKSVENLHNTDKLEVESLYLESIVTDWT